MRAQSSYDYAIVRVVPRVERGEFVNAGVILFCRTRRFLGTLSDRDIVTRCVAAAKHPMHTRADELMRRNTPVVGPGQELDGYRVELDTDPSESHLRATITVVDEDSRVVGFISHPEQVTGVIVGPA